MTFKKVPKGATKNTESPTVSQLTSRPFAPIVKQTTSTPTPDQQAPQTHELLQRKTNLLAIPGLMAEPKRRQPQLIQAKLTIGQPGDKYEQEADDVARQVVQKIHHPQTKKLQREYLPENELQMKSMVQRRTYVGGMDASVDFEAQIKQARGSGQPLAKSIKSPMEKGFMADFSKVKIHTDSQADQLNQSIHAKAFTTQKDIFFRQGAYQPESKEGQELVAHELTHVVQQDPNTVQAKSDMVQKAPDMVIQRGLKTLENVPSRDLYAEDQQERQRHRKEGGKLKEKIKSTEHQPNTEIETVKPGLKLDTSKTYPLNTSG